MTPSPATIDPGEVEQRLRARVDSHNYRLRNVGFYGDGDMSLDTQAADTINTLVAENERLRLGIKPFADLYNQITADHGPDWFADEGTAMRAALSYPVANSALVWRHFRLAAEAALSLPVDQGEGDGSSRDHDQTVSVALESVIAVARAAQIYFDGYCQDQAADDALDCVGCTQAQHEAAKALKAALAEYSEDALRFLFSCAKPALELVGRVKP